MRSNCERTWHHSVQYLDLFKVLHMFIAGSIWSTKVNIVQVCLYVLCLSAMLKKGELLQSFCGQMPFLSPTSRNHSLDPILSLATLPGEGASLPSCRLSDASTPGSPGKKQLLKWCVCMFLCLSCPSTPTAKFGLKKRQWGSQLRLGMWRGSNSTLTTFKVVCFFHLRNSPNVMKSLSSNVHISPLWPLNNWFSKWKEQVKTNN